ncbi:MAG: CBS domain-containing protein [Candidatus Delongbacteria bacterium]|nr:CBS domain-containing protein [Candidatus Delongbacteria bacterium]
MDNPTKDTSKTQELTYELRVKDAMDVNFITIESSTSMKSLREILRKKRILGVPVADNGQLVGIISIEDYVECMENGNLDEIVGNVMTKNVITIFSDEPLINAVRNFDKYHFTRFPVLERENGKIVGMVSKIDTIKGILKKLEIAYDDKHLNKFSTRSLINDLIADKICIELKYDVEGGNFEKAGNASTRLKKSLKKLGLSSSITRRVTISTYEAEINIVSYTEKGVITARVYSDKITVNLEDKGPGIEDVDKAMTPGYSNAPGWVRELGFGAGMGLPNMKKFSDEMTVNSVVGKGTTLNLVFYLNE